MVVGVEASNGRRQQQQQQQQPQVSIDLQIGNPLRTVHPSPINSDQVVLVPSLFGSDLNMTTFDELREELEPLLRDKYRPRYQQNQSNINNNDNRENNKEDEVALGGGMLGMARTGGGGILVAPKSLGAAALALAVASGRSERTATPPLCVTTTTEAPTNTTGTDYFVAAQGIDAVLHDEKVNEHGEEEEDAAAAAACALPAPRTAEEDLLAAPRRVSQSESTGRLNCRAVAEVVKRLCQYYSIDLNTALVNVGVFVGRPDNVRARPAQSPKFLSSCFVVAAFGTARKMVLGHSGGSSSSGGAAASSSSFTVSLANNTAVAILRDVTANGWLYKIVEDSSSSDAVTRTTDEETITVLISGRCCAVRNVVPSAPRPQQLLLRSQSNAGGGFHADATGLRRRVSVGPEGVGGGVSDAPPPTGEERYYSGRDGNPNGRRPSRSPDHHRDESSWYGAADRHGGGGRLDPDRYHHRDSADRHVRRPDRSADRSSYGRVAARGGGIRDDGEIDEDRPQRRDHHRHHRSRSRSRSPSGRRLHHHYEPAKDWR